MKQDPTWQECFSEWEKSGNPAVRRLVRRCKDLEARLKATTGALGYAHEDCSNIYYLNEMKEVEFTLNKKPSEYGEME